MRHSWIFIFVLLAYWWAGKFTSETDKTQTRQGIVSDSIYLSADPISNAAQAEDSIKTLDSLLMYNRQHLTSTEDL